LPPQLAIWLNQTFKVEAFALRDLHLRDAEDELSGVNYLDRVDDNYPGRF
jgi:predicted nuclease of predicted toxin-antitoxin system